MTKGGDRPMTPMESAWKNKGLKPKTLSWAEYEAQALAIDEDLMQEDHFMPADGDNPEGFTSESNKEACKAEVARMMLMILNKKEGESYKDAYDRCNDDGTDLDQVRAAFMINDKSVPDDVKQCWKE